MQKYCLTALLLWALAACKKEELVTDRGLDLDINSYTKLSFDYKGRIRASPAMRAEWKLLCNSVEPVWLSIGGGTPIPYMPPGKDTLQLMNIKTGGVDFSGEFDIKDSTDDLTFFQVDSSFRPVIVRNDQASEPLPPENVIKMRLANFCSELGTDPIDIVMKQYNLYYEELRTDTLHNIVPDFSRNYFLLKLVKYTADWGDEIFATPYATFCKSSDKSLLVLKQQAVPGFELGIPLYATPGSVYTYYLYGTYKTDDSGNVLELTDLFSLF